MTTQRIGSKLAEDLLHDDHGHEEDDDRALAREADIVHAPAIDETAADPQAWKKAEFFV